VGRRGLGVVRRALRHHAAVFPHHQHLWCALGGWCEPPPQLAPPGGAPSSVAFPAASWSPAGRLSRRACPRPWEGTREPLLATPSLSPPPLAAAPWLRLCHVTARPSLPPLFAAPSLNAASSSRASPT
jgi:hypothetical protein